MMVEADWAASALATTKSASIREQLRSFEFLLNMALTREMRASALDPDEVVGALNRQEGKKLSQVIEDAEKKKRRSRKKSKVRLR